MTKEPQDSEVSLLREDRIFFTYLHVAPAADLTGQLLKVGCSGVAYETVTDRRARLPLNPNQLPRHIACLRNCEG